MLISIVWKFVFAFCMNLYLLHNLTCLDLCVLACVFFSSFSLNFPHNTYQDIRIEGGYEAVPTRDIHMKQIDFEEIWLDFLEHYVMPLQEEVFRGYASEVGYIANYP